MIFISDHEKGHNRWFHVMHLAYRKSVGFFQFGLHCLYGCVPSVLCKTRIDVELFSDDIMIKIIVPQVKTFAYRRQGRIFYLVFRFRPVMLSEMSDVPIKRKTTE